MKNFFLFFFLFIVLNIADTEQKINTKEEIDEIVKNIKKISESNYCDIDTLRIKLEIFYLDQYKKNELYSQLINACRRIDKEIFIKVLYTFFKKEIEENKEMTLQVQSENEKTERDNGLALYLCKKFMILIGYDDSYC